LQYPQSSKKTREWRDVSSAVPGAVGEGTAVVSSRNWSVDLAWEQIPVNLRVAAKIFASGKTAKHHIKPIRFFIVDISCLQSAWDKTTIMSCGPSGTAGKCQINQAEEP